MKRFENKHIFVASIFVLIFAIGIFDSCSPMTQRDRHYYELFYHAYSKAILRNRAVDGLGYICTSMAINGYSGLEMASIGRKAQRDAIRESKKVIPNTDNSPSRKKLSFGERVKRFFT